MRHVAAPLPFPRPQRLSSGLASHREWNQDLLLANSRLSRRPVSLNARSAHLVGLMLGWCRGRCRTFLEYGPLALLQRLSRVERMTGSNPHCQLGRSSYPTAFPCPARILAA